MKNSVKETTLVAVAKTIKGNAFSFIPNYLTEKGDKADYWVQLGYSHENAMLFDFQALADNKDKIFETLSKDFDVETITLAYNEMYASLEKRLSSEEFKEKLRLQNDATINRSDAMNDAFTFLAKGIFRHNESGEIHVKGLQVKKRVILKSESSYKEPVSDKAKIKAKIPFICEFRQSKIRSFKLEKLTIKLQGATI
jgi:hypothetical protein